mgnify:CR=1 FL=1
MEKWDAFDKGFNKIENLTVEVIPIMSNYWGEQITVAGNLFEVLKSVECVGNDIINLPCGEGEFFKAGF